MHIEMIKRLNQQITTEKIVCERSSNATNVLEYANSGRFNGKFNDVTIKVNDVSFPAHRMVLSCLCKYFEAMFETEMREKHEDIVHIHGVTPNAMKLILDFLYMGSIEIVKENVYDLLSASNLMQIDEIKTFCLEFLENSLSVDTCLAISYLFRLYGSDHSQEQIKLFIARNIESIIELNDFKNLSKDELHALFKETSQNCTSGGRNCGKRKRESEICETSKCKSYVKWCEHNLANQPDAFGDLLDEIDLELLPRDYLENVLASQPFVQENNKCLRTLLGKMLSQSKKIRLKEVVLSIGGTPTSVKKVFPALDKSIDRSFPALDRTCVGHCCVKMQNYIYVFGGSTSLNNPIQSITNRVHRLNLSEEPLKWEEVAPTKKKRYLAAAAVLSDIIFVVGGRMCGRSSEYYVPGVNKWSTMTAMKVARFGHSLVACKGSLYAVGGYGRNCCLTSVERYEPHANVWTEGAPMTIGRESFAAVTINDVIYAVGGQSYEIAQNSVEKYDVVANQWSRVNAMQYKRWEHSACVMQGKIYVVGGRDNDNNRVMQIECYHPETEWTVVGEIDTPHLQHSLVTVE
ncbi:unnamed protein product [Clavelina lepadiformis]|uniref:BTB domain-containing protein n=1 Tax=Clavelina lepadiformis TaxID=159417 RepID=A0ABP0FTU1_CLALP